MTIFDLNHVEPFWEDALSLYTEPVNIVATHPILPQYSEIHYCVIISICKTMNVINRKFLRPTHQNITALNAR